MLRLFVGIELSARAEAASVAARGAAARRTLGRSRQFPPDVALYRRGRRGRRRRYRRGAGAAQGASRFALQLAGTGVFGDGKPRTLWVGVEQRARRCGPARQDRAGPDPRRPAPEPRKFAPHVTLARLHDPAMRRARRRFSRRNAGFRAEPLPVDAVQPDRELSDQGRLGL